MADLAKLVVRLEAQSAQLLTELEKANRRIDRFAAQTSKTLQKWTGGLLAAFSARALIQFGSQILDSQAKLGDLAQQAGVTVESLSRLGYAASQSGSDVESLNTGLGALSKTAVAVKSGSKEAAAAFTAIGISATRADGSIKKADELLLEIADSFAAHADGAEKSALAQQLFGKSGRELIPFLNKGAAGIEELTAKADALGITVSTKASQAADDFNNSMNTLGAVVKGVVGRALTDVVPIFTDFAKSQTDAAAGSESMNTAARVLAGGLKVLITAGVFVGEIFDRVGDTLGAVAAATVAAFKGNFREARDILRDLDAQTAESGQDMADTLKRIWTDAGKSIADETAKAADEVDKNLKKPNFKILNSEIEKSADAAIKKLTEFNANLAEQVAEFGKGEAAATEYRLTIGSMADDVEKAGAKGKELAASIIAQADALERLQNSQAVAAIDQQIQELTGHTVEAAAAVFDLENRMLKASLARQNDEAGLAALERLRELTVAQAEYNKLELESQKIKDDLANLEDRIRHSQEVGAINELEALSQLDSARKDAVVRLQEILDKQTKIANASGNAALILDSKRAADELTKLAEQTNLFRQKVKGTIEDIASDEFGAFLSGAKSAGDAVKGFINDLEAEITRFVAKDLMRKLFNSMSGTGEDGSGGLLGSAVNFLGGLFGFGGPRDRGGRGRPGMAYAIGTGAQPEVYVPDQPGTFMPAGDFARAGGQVEQNIYVQGRVDARSARQLEIEAARRQRISQARLG